MEQNMRYSLAGTQKKTEQSPIAFPVTQIMEVLALHFRKC